jgi:hypothetical protein
MSYADAVTRISQIRAQMADLSTAFDPPAAAPTAPAASTSAASAAPGLTSAPTTGASTFADALAQAQATRPAATAGAGATTLPAAAQGVLTTDQQQFAARLAQDTGLDPGVISAWLLAEESGGAAQSRQSDNNNDWLNVGYTDSATFGSADSVWSDPITAADATAGWLKGQNTIPGYGTASAGIQSILATAGSSPQAQIAALQGSGWASSGYPDLPSLYSQVAG